MLMLCELYMHQVQLLAACCLSDIFRIFAPVPPYSKSEIRQIFSLFFDELQQLNDQNAANFSRVFYLLESLAVVNTCLILCTMDDEDLLIQLFQLFFDLAHVSEDVVYQ